MTADMQIQGNRYDLGKLTFLALDCANGFIGTVPSDPESAKRALAILRSVVEWTNPTLLPSKTWYVERTISPSWVKRVVYAIALMGVGRRKIEMCLETAVVPSPITLQGMGNPCAAPPRAGPKSPGRPRKVVKAVCQPAYC